MRVDDVAVMGMGLADIARRVIGCHLIQETRVQKRVDDVAAKANGPGGYCTPRHRMSFNPRNEGSKRLFDDVAHTYWQAPPLPLGGPHAERPVALVARVQA